MFSRVIIPAILMLVLYHYMDIKTVRSGDEHMDALISHVSYGGLWILIGYFISQSIKNNSPQCTQPNRARK